MCVCVCVCCKLHFACWILFTHSPVYLGCVSASVDLCGWLTAIWCLLETIRGRYCSVMCDDPISSLPFVCVCVSSLQGIVSD